jgi:ribosomal protein S6--L-glutamate ligase
MILSFHPCYVADVNRLCAGRDPDEADLEAIRSADAVVLPQGCRPSLYRMARQNNPHVFPNYDACFEYPGKTGQARLFQKLDAPRPHTWIFENIEQFRRRENAVQDAGFPLVLKLDWGGEGETVFLLQTPEDLKRAVVTAADYERTGQAGFVIQRFVPHGHRSLRVAVIGHFRAAYWRVQDSSRAFGTSVAKGARIDTTSDSHLIQMGQGMVDDFCRRSGINLAGFDLIFEETAQSDESPRPLFLEINYFFGRTGLGGSDHFYETLQAAIDRWLADLGLAVSRTSMETCSGEKP